MQIRKATIDDLHTIQTIAKAAWEDSFHAFLSPEQLAFDFNREYCDERLTEILLDPSKTFTLYSQVAELPNTSPRRGFTEVSPDPNHPTGWFINKLYLHPNAKGTGLGRAIIKHLCALAKEEDISQLKLLVNRHNTAVGFYQHLGFAITRTVDAEIGTNPTGQPYWRRDYEMVLFI